jgi:hypothetical protein
MTIERKHTMGYGSVVDEVYKRNPVCSWCGKMWPCDAGAYEDFIAEIVTMLEGIAGGFEATTDCPDPEDEDYLVYRTSSTVLDSAAKLLRRAIVKIEKDMP